MDAMDAELGTSKVSQTFDRLPVSHPLAMGGEAGESAAETSEGKRPQEDGPAGGGASGSAGALQPVDLDMNLLKNLVQSYNAQEGLAGPFSNLLGRMGVDVSGNAATAEALVRLERDETDPATN